jgi:hypothetical protein
LIDLKANIFEGPEFFDIFAYMTPRSPDLRDQSFGFLDDGISQRITFAVGLVADQIRFSEILRPYYNITHDIPQSSNSRTRLSSRIGAAGLFLTAFFERLRKSGPFASKAFCDPATAPKSAEHSRKLTICFSPRWKIELSRKSLTVINLCLPPLGLQNGQANNSSCHHVTFVKTSLKSCFSKKYL